METAAMSDLTGSVTRSMNDLFGFDITGAIMGSKSHLNADNVASAIWRVGWPGVREAVYNVVNRAMAVHDDPLEVMDALAETATALYPLDVADALAAVALPGHSRSGALFVTAECVENEETLTGRTVLAKVWRCDDEGRWGTVDELEMDDADPSAAIDEALRTCLPFIVDGAISAEVPFEVATAAMGLDDGGVAKPSALSHALRALIESNAELAGMSEEDVAPRSLAGVLTAPDEAEMGLGLDELMSAARTAADSKPIASTPRGGTRAEDGLR